MKSVLTQSAVLVILVGSLVQAQTTPSKTTPKRSTVTAREVEELRNALAAQGQRIDQQQRQIQTLTDEMHKRDAELQQAKQEVQKLEATASAAVSQSAQDQQTVSTLNAEVNDLKQNQTNAALSLQETQKNIHRVWRIPSRFITKASTSPLEAVPDFVPVLLAVSLSSARRTWILKRGTQMMKGRVAMPRSVSHSMTTSLSFPFSILPSPPDSEFTVVFRTRQEPHDF